MASWTNVVFSSNCVFLCYAILLCVATLHVFCCGDHFLAQVLFEHFSFSNRCVGNDGIDSDSYGEDSVSLQMPKR